MASDFDFDDAYDDRPRRARYRCPYCGSGMTPVYVQKVSPLGWVIFTIGLLFFIIGCLIGLLFKKNVKVCPQCGHRLR